MDSMPSPKSWQQRLFSALMLVLLVAGGARLAWELLAPVLPFLIVGVVLLGIYWFIWRRPR